MAISLQIIWQINQTNVLLQTVLVTVTDLLKQKQTKINALFDTGSQRPVLRKEKIIIKVFGTEDTCLKTVDVVPLKLLSSSKKIVLEPLCTPTICSNVLNQDLKQFRIIMNTLKIYNWQIFQTKVVNV